MRVLVFGGTGFVGHSLVPLLRQRQHDVMALSRARELPPRLAASGARLLHGDLLSPSVLELDTAGVDVMVLLAAPRIFGRRLGSRRFAKLKAEITTMSTHTLELARRRSCPIIITAGTAFKTSGDQVADETWPIERFGATRIGEDVDPMVQKIVQAGTPKVVWMLPGQIYGPGGMFMMMYRFPGARGQEFGGFAGLPSWADAVRPLVGPVWTIGVYALALTKIQTLSLVRSCTVVVIGMIPEGLVTLVFVR